MRRSRRLWIKFSEVTMKVDEEWRPIEGTNEEYWVSSKEE